MTSGKYAISLWKKRRENSETGITLYSYFPKVDATRLFDNTTRTAFSQILQLQTVYSQLNEYRQKLGQTKINRCETTDHYLLQCPLQEQPRNIMALTLGRDIGPYHLDLQLLGHNPDKDENTKGQTES